MTLLAQTRIAAHFVENHTREVLDFFDELPEEKQLRLIEELSFESALTLLAKSRSEVVARFFLRLRNVQDYLKRLDPARVARVSAHFDESEREQLFSQAPKHLVNEVQQILTYPPDTAGSLMETRIPLFRGTQTAGHVLNELRKASPQNTSQIYIVDESGSLCGKLALPELICADNDDLLSNLALASESVHEMTPKEEIVELIESTKLQSLPVVNTNGEPLGVIRQDRVVQILQGDAMGSLQTMVGVSADEKALSPPHFAIRKRLPWLTVNLGTTFVAAAVVGLFESTISQITALAVLLPVVAGQSGNTGAQAQAVTMRGLALREIRLHHKWRVITKECVIGLCNGLVIGVLCGLSVYFWNGSLALSAVITAAMVIAMCAASLAGAAIPMVLTAMGQDPATSSSIVLTTVTDIVGFLSFLGLAAAFAQAIGV